jgi:arylformamidase
MYAKSGSLAPDVDAAEQIRVIHDISVPLRTGMVVYPGDPPMTMTRAMSLAAGDIANVSQMELGVHTGTHVDAPLHFFDGAPAVEALELDALVGPAEVVEVTGPGDIGPDAVVEGAERVLFKTRNSAAWAEDRFYEEYASISPEAASRLVDAGVRLVGVDYLSVGGVETHQTLLRAGMIAVEGLDLREIEPGPYMLVCLPLKLVGADGAPARAILIEP